MVYHSVMSVRVIAGIVINTSGRCAFELHHTAGEFRGFSNRVFMPNG